MRYQFIPHIRTPEDLGIAAFGSPNASVVQASPKDRIDRAEHGRRLAELEGGVFTDNGYCTPIDGGAADAT